MVGGLSLREIAEQQEKINKLREEAVENIASITGIFDQNKLAMLTLCDRKQFLDSCRSHYSLPVSMSDSAVKEYISSRLLQEPVEQKKPIKPMPAGVNLSASFAKTVRDLFNGRTFSSSGVVPIAHWLGYADGHLTGMGLGPDDKDFVRYSWLSMTEYVNFWRSTKSLHGEDGRSRYFYGIYAIKVRSKDGTYRELVNSRFGSETGSFVDSDIQSQTIQSDKLFCRPLQSISVLKALISYVYDECAWGKDFVQKLGERVIDSWSGKPSSDAIIKEFLIPGSVVRASKLDKTFTNGCIKLPGTFSHNGITDTLCIYNINIRRHKNDKGYSDVYFWFNNEAYYMSFVRYLADSLHVTSLRGMEEFFNSTLKFLVRP